MEGCHESPTSIITDRPRVTLPVLMLVSPYISHMPECGMVVRLYKWRWRGSGPNVSCFIYIMFPRCSANAVDNVVNLVYKERGL